MIAITRFTVTAARLHHHAVRLPLNIWLPFLGCLAVLGAASLSALVSQARSCGASSAPCDAPVGARLLLGDKDPRLNAIRAAMLRREYRQCRLTEDGLRRALAANDTSATLRWHVRADTVRAGYDLIAAQSTDQVFQATGLPRRF